MYIQFHKYKQHKAVQPLYSYVCLNVWIGPCRYDEGVSNLNEPESLLAHEKSNEKLLRPRSRLSPLTRTVKVQHLCRTERVASSPQEKRRDVNPRHGLPDPVTASHVDDAIHPLRVRRIELWLFGRYLRSTSCIRKENEGERESVKNSCYRYSSGVKLPRGEYSGNAYY